MNQILALREKRAKAWESLHLRTMFHRKSLRLETGFCSHHFHFLPSSKTSVSSCPSFYDCVLSTQKGPQPDTLFLIIVLKTHFIIFDIFI